MKKMNTVQKTILGTSVALFATTGAITAAGIIFGFSTPLWVEVLAAASGFHSTVFIYNQTKDVK